jgi:hypothetical protein
MIVLICAANRVEVTCDASNDPADLDFDLDGLATGKQATSLNVAPGRTLLM